MEASKQSQVGAEVSESSRRRQDGGTAVTKQAQQQERLRGGRGRCAGPDGRLRAEARRSRLPDFYTRRLGVGRMPLFQGWGRQVDEEWYWALSSHTRSENMLGPLRETKWLPWSSADQAHSSAPRPPASQHHLPCYHTRVPVRAFTSLSFNETKQITKWLSWGQWARKW